MCAKSRARPCLLQPQTEQPLKYKYDKGSDDESDETTGINKETI